MTRPLTAAERDAEIVRGMLAKFPGFVRLLKLRASSEWRNASYAVRGQYADAMATFARLDSLPDAELVASVRSMVESRSATDDALAKYAQQEQQRERSAHAAIELATRHSVGAPGGRARATKLKAQSAEKEGIIGAEVTRVLASDALRIATNPAARRLSAKEIAADILKRQTALGISRHYHYTERALYELVRRQIRSQRG